MNMPLLALAAAAGAVSREGRSSTGAPPRVTYRADSAWLWGGCWRRCGPGGGGCGEARREACRPARIAARSVTAAAWLLGEGERGEAEEGGRGAGEGAAAVGDADSLPWSAAEAPAAAAAAAAVAIPAAAAAAAAASDAAAAPAPAPAPPAAAAAAGLCRALALVTSARRPTFSSFMAANSSRCCCALRMRSTKAASVALLRASVRAAGSLPCRLSSAPRCAPPPAATVGLTSAARTSAGRRPGCAREASEMLG